MSLDSQTITNDKPNNGVYIIIIIIQLSNTIHRDPSISNSLAIAKTKQFYNYIPPISNPLPKMKSMRPSKKKLAQWQYKKHELSQLQQSPQDFELYLLAKPQELKKQFIQQVPYYWCHNKITKDHQFELYINELVSHQLQVKGFPYVDNMLQAIDQQCKGNFKVICQLDHLERVLEFHSDNKKLICIHVFDEQLNKKTTNAPKSKKIQIKSSQFKTFKRLLYRKNYQKNESQTFINATRITNWDISQVNQSRLVLKTLLVAKNDHKGKQDFLRLANVVQQQLGKVAQYEMTYKVQSTPQEAIKWYTKESFYHRLVNNTLKAGKGNPLLLSYIRFPVKQLYTSIKSLYTRKQLHKQSFQCYRGGRISQKQLQFYKSNTRGFIQMQGFLSCSKNKQQMQQFIVNCVFKIVVNNLQRGSEWDHGFCFLDEKELTEFVKQEEVLFNVFCAMEIRTVGREVYGGKEVDVITLEYGSLASMLYQKKHGLVLKERQHNEMCINNYMALKPYYDSIQNQADCFRFFSKFKQVQQYYTTLLSHLQKVNSTDEQKYFNSYYNLGQNYLSQKNYLKAKQFFHKAKQLLQSSATLSKDQLKQSRVYNGLGIASKHLNKPIQAKQNYLKTIQLIQKNRNKNVRVYLATAYNNLAAILIQQLQQQQAIQYYQKSLNLLQDQENQTVANVHYNLGLYHLRKSSYKQSIRNLIKSLQIYNKLFGTHKATITCHVKLGQAYLKSGSLNYNNHFDTAMDMMKNLTFATRDQYIDIKREIQEVKSSHKRQLSRATSSSLASHQMQDVFSFMRNNQEVERYLSKQPKKNYNNSENFYLQHQVFSLPLVKKTNNTNTSALKIPPTSNMTSLQSILFSNNLPNIDKKNNHSIYSGYTNDSNPTTITQNDKLRHLRGKNILENQTPYTYQSQSNNRYKSEGDTKSPFIEKKQHVENTYQDMIDAKMAQFDKNDFVSNLKQGRPKRSLIFG